MELILLQKVVNLGSLGDKVTVKPGYGRNFLIPQGKAKRATADNLAEFEKRRAELEKAQADQLAAAQAKAGELDGLTVQMTRKAGVDGRLFGSVTNFDVAEVLEAQGHAVERSAIRMPEGPLKTIGDHDVSVVLHTDVVVNVKIAVLGEHVL